MRLFDLNDAGQVGFNADLAGTSDGNGIFIGDGLTAPVQIAREGERAPSGNGFYSSLGGSALNEAGQVAFFASLRDTSAGFFDGIGIFRGSAFGPTTEIVRRSQAAPDANGFFTGFGGPVLNNTGQIAFSASLAGTASDFDDDTGIFLSDDITGLSQVVREGQAAPDGNGRFGNFVVLTNNTAINDAGQTVFSADLTDTAGGSRDHEGLFRGEGTTSITQIARAGQTTPGGNGVFDNFGAFGLSETGQVAFTAGLTDTNGLFSLGRGLFVYDDSLGLLEVARTGILFQGSIIQSIGIRTEDADIGGFNDQGQIAFGFVLANGRTGVALATLSGLSPEPDPSDAVIGDFNGDEFVGQADLDLVLLNFGDGVLPAGFDPNAVPGGGGFDGQISQNELDSVLLNFGGGQQAGVTAVPEPSTLLLLGFSGGLALGRRRWR